MVNTPSPVSLNAELNLWGANGEIQFDKDREAARQYFLQEVNPNTVFFHNIFEKLDYLFDNGYYNKATFDQYENSFIKKLYQQAYSYKFRFKSFVGALKFYTGYALKTNNGARWLERYEDRVVANALELAEGDETLAQELVEKIITGQFNPATPTFANAGLANSGERVSCFEAGTQILTPQGLIEIQDIQPGGQVLTHDGSFQEVKAVGSRDEHKGFIELYFVGEETPFRSTREHPVLAKTVRKIAPVHVGDGDTEDLKWIAVADIQPGDSVATLGEDDQYVLREVDSTTFDLPEGPVQVYNLETANHTYVVGGVVTHNCFLLDTHDSLDSIMQTLKSAANLSKMGGGVGINLSNLRAEGDPIKNVEGVGSGVVPYAKVIEDTFRWVNQLGRREGAAVGYIHAHHMDVMKLLDSKRENSDESIRLKTLSVGLVIPDITYELAAKGEDMYLFSPYDVAKKYGVEFSEVDITEHYRELVEDPDIRKKRIPARKFFSTLAELRAESGYPYILNIDTANKENPVDGKIKMSNLCSEILQVQEPSTFTEEGNYDQVGKDISCNLGSMNIARVMESGDPGAAVEVAVRALTAVSDRTDIKRAPTVARANREMHSIGLGQMNLAGFFGKEKMIYGDEDSLEFTSAYFSMINYYSILASNVIAQERGEVFDGFERSSYASGEYFSRYEEDFRPTREKVVDIFNKYHIEVPSPQDWAELKENVMTHGLYNSYRQAVAPTGSLAYLTHSTPSLSPVTGLVEIRKEGKMGRVYFPAPEMDESNKEYFVDAYALGWRSVVDVYAAVQPHVDQAMSMNLFYREPSMKEFVGSIMYTHKKGVKTAYYARLQQTAIEGTEQEDCVSCTL